MALSANQVAFYGATPTDYMNALAAAYVNLVPLANVTGDFNTAARGSKTGRTW